MTGPKRNAAALALAACAMFLGGCREELYTNLTQREAAEMLVVLQGRGISAERVQTATGYQLEVEGGDFSRAVSVLSQAGYPKTTFQSMDQLFPGDRMIMSPFEQKVRFRYALEQELCKTLMSLHGVTNANVHIVIPERDLRGQPVSAPSSSVVVTLNSVTDPAEIIPQIKMVVANAVDGLSYDRVAVVADLQPAQLSSSVP